jgi:hypothetical protein
MKVTCPFTVRSEIAIAWPISALLSPRRISLSTDDPGRSLEAEHPLQRLEAVDPRQAQVEQADVWAAIRHQLQRLLPAAGLPHHDEVGLPLEKIQEPGPQDRMVVDQENADRA